MTNAILSDRGAGLDGEPLALASIGGVRRPVKVVEHPAFVPRRRLREAATATMTTVRVPVVSLDPCPRPSRTPSTLPAFQQVA